MYMRFNPLKKRKLTTLTKSMLVVSGQSILIAVFVISCSLKVTPMIIGVTTMCTSIFLWAWWMRSVIKESSVLWNKTEDNLKELIVDVDEVRSLIASTLIRTELVRKYHNQDYSYRGEFDA